MTLKPDMPSARSVSAGQAFGPVADVVSYGFARRGAGQSSLISATSRLYPVVFNGVPA